MENKKAAPAKGELQPLSSIINLDDFQKQGQERLIPKTYAFYSSAADDLFSLQGNKSAFTKVLFRPRVLHGVADTSLDTTLLGYAARMPIYIAPAAQARLAHSEGEMALAKAAGVYGIPYCLSNQASCSPEEVASVAVPGQELWFQLYMNKDRSKSQEVLRRVNALPAFTKIWLTVDTPQVGKREADERIKTAVAIESGTGQGKPTAITGGIAKQSSQFLDQDLNWKDIAWIHKQIKLPVIVKGVQRFEDAVKAYEYGLQGICLSNHGGRQLDTAYVITSENSS